MFFGKMREKDAKIASLEARIQELEQQQSSDKVILKEIENVLQKFSKGLCGFRVNGHSSNPDYNIIKDNLNLAIESTQDNLDLAIKVLIEYGNANFAYDVDTTNLSGKTGSVILGIRALGSSISELLALLDTTSEELNEEIKVLTNASNMLSTASNQAAASLEETAASLEEITSTIANNSSNALKMEQLAKEVTKSANQGEQLANQTFESMESIAHEVNAINDAIIVIDQIAFQTNILSLNAAVEAATAGEAGKGFAVVAGEVRNLASRSADAAKEIKDIVQNATDKASRGKAIAENMIDGYHILNTNIQNQDNIINDVSVATKEQQDAIEQINDAVAELDKTTQQNASSASDINQQTKHIENLSTKLVDVVNHTQYLKISKEQICDIDMMFQLNRLKLDHIKFKDTNLAKLNTKTTWRVATEHECNLGKWMDQQERNNESFTTTSNWNKLKDFHAGVHKNVQSVIDNNSKDNTSVILQLSHDIDKTISDVFWSVQQVKRDKCH